MTKRPFITLPSGFRRRMTTEEVKKARKKKDKDIMKVYYDLIGGKK